MPGLSRLVVLFVLATSVFTSFNLPDALSQKASASPASGNVWAWGLNSDGEFGMGTNAVNSTYPIPTGLGNIVATSAYMALDANGNVWDWAFGPGEPSCTCVPKQMSGIGKVTAVAGSAPFTQRIVIRDDGTVWTWGYNSVGELGIGTTNGPDYCGPFSCSRTPVQVPGLSNVVAVSAGGGFDMALQSNGTLWAWGVNNVGQLGYPTPAGYSATPEPVPGLPAISAIAAGPKYSLAVAATTGTVWAWGDNNYGELGNGTQTNSSTPVQVSGLSGVSAVSAPANAQNPASLALRSDGTVWAWGDDSAGQLGNGTSSGLPTCTNSGYPCATTPVEVSQGSGLSNATSVSEGDRASYAIDSHGIAWAWGGLTGTGGDRFSCQCSDVPVQVSALTGVTAIYGGAGYALAVTPDRASTTLVAQPAVVKTSGTPAVNAFTLKATLTYGNGFPLPNKTVWFSSGGNWCSAVTDSTGTASCDLLFPTNEPFLQAVITTKSYSASFAGDTTFIPSSTSAGLIG